MTTTRPACKQSVVSREPTNLNAALAGCRPCSGALASHCRSFCWCTDYSAPDVVSHFSAKQAVLAGYVLRTAVGWFLRLDREAARREADLVLQDPTSLKKVRTSGCVLAAAIMYHLRRWLQQTCSQVPTPSVFEEASKALSVIVPAYNEEFRLPGTLQEAIRWC